jgi:2-hydroxychromene-2-carboxylate isomerase
MGCRSVVGPGAGLRFVLEDDLPMSDKSRNQKPCELPEHSPDIEFFWDPVCPFAWQTSRWLRRVAQLRGLTVDWRFINLSILNEERDYDNEFPEGYRESHDRGRRMLRVAAAVRAAEGAGAMDRLYRAFGETIWHREVDDGADFRADVATSDHLTQVLDRAGVDRLHADAAADPSWDAELRAETIEAVGRTGDDVGTPIITFGPPDGPSIFGPVISSVPETDEECLALYDATVTLCGFSTFSELKRSARPRLDLPVITGRPG